MLIVVGPAPQRRAGGAEAANLTAAEEARVTELLRGEGAP